MKETKDLAIALRIKGSSYAQIREKLGVAKSTLSFWLRDIELSEQAKKKISSRVYKTSILALIERNK